MIWPVTIIAGLTGLVVASIPGALLGILLGSIVDRNLGFSSWSQLRARLQPRPAKKLNAQQVLFMLLGHLAKSSGRVTPEHIQLARLEMQRLQLFGSAQTAAIAAFSAGKDCQLLDLTNALRRHYRSPEQAERLLLVGWRMVWVKGPATAEQRNILQQSARWLNCSKAALMVLKSRRELSAMIGHTQLAMTSRLPCSCWQCAVPIPLQLLKRLIAANSASIIPIK